MFLDSARVLLSCTDKNWISVIVVIRPVFSDLVTIEVNNSVCNVEIRSA